MQKEAQYGYVKWLHGIPSLVWISLWTWLPATFLDACNPYTQACKHWHMPMHTHWHISCAYTLTYICAYTLTHWCIICAYIQAVPNAVHKVKLLPFATQYVNTKEHVFDDYSYQSGKHRWQSPIYTCRDDIMMTSHNNVVTYGLWEDILIDGLLCILSTSHLVYSNITNTIRGLPSSKKHQYVIVQPNNIVMIIMS